MGLKDRILHEMNQAMKAGDATKVSTLRLLRAAIKNKEIEKRAEVDDFDVIDLIIGSIKQHKESIKLFAQGERGDLVEKESKELEILSSFLPEQMGRDELLAKIRETIDRLGANSERDLGKVMRSLMPEIKGRAEGSLVRSLVMEILSPK